MADPAASPSDHSSDQSPAIAAPPSDAPPPPSSSRRVPPPCWSVEETLALIDSYQEKWYALRRGNLRAHHWQEVADAVSLRCHRLPAIKTAVQCRHKIEKLRKRYRSERARSLRSHPSAPPTSSWVFFRKMDSMERGGNPSGAATTRAVPSPPSLSASSSGDPASSSSESNPIANGKSSGGNLNLRPLKGIRSKFDRIPNFRRDVRLFADARPTGLVETRRRAERKRSKEGDSLGKVTEVLRIMCDSFMRIEQMKMDMASEIHKLRMEMELKRAEMMLDSQRRIVDSFLDGIAGTKRARTLSHDM